MESRGKQLKELQILKKISFYSQRTIEWNTKLQSARLIDQTLLPSRLSFVECHRVRELVRAIKSMQIRGAPALGVAGAMGIALAAKESKGDPKKLRRLALELKNSRPTAVNLSWGVEKALGFWENIASPADEKDHIPELISFAKNLADQDVEINKTLSNIGQSLIPDGSSVLTHCN